MIVEGISYLIKVMVCQAGFLIVYQLLISKAGKHDWSRSYLLITMIGSFLLPILKFQVPAQQTLPLSILEEEVVHPVEQVISDVASIPEASNKRPFYWLNTAILYAGYFGIVILLLTRFCRNLKVLLTQIKKLPYGTHEGIKLYDTRELAPFSFFDAVFVPRELKANKGYHQILEHELAHARHWHSFDRLLTDFIVAFLWFNPFIYWYRNALKTVHEYQADAYVLRKYPDKIAYQEILYMELFKPAYGLVNHFNTSLIKKRIVMMNQKRNIVHKLLPFLALPIVLMLSLAFSIREVNTPVESMIREHINTGPVSAALPDYILPQEPVKPEILPLDKSSMEKMSSGFGMRLDPRTKERHHHQGIDFVAPIGTDVYATADGVVKTAQSKPDGYGIMVEITHGNEGEYMTRYAHMDSFEVKVGQTVKKGDVIGKVGSSGWSTGPHLHYEVRLHGKPVDPEDYITDVSF